MPQFAVVMPLYNKAPYVRKAVESVVAQSCRDWELWVVDDGSADGGAAVVEQFADPRIHLHRQANAGVGAARNRGAALSGGDKADGASSGEAAFRSPYLCFLDADDWWEPTFLEEMAALIGRHPSAGIYGSGYYIVKNSRRREAPIGWEEGFVEGEVNYCQVYARTLCMPLTSISVCMPREVFEEMGGFPEGIRLGEDFLLWVHTALRHKVVMTRQPMANYNQDVDVAYRGTHHLHAPEHNMLWHLGDLEPTEQTNRDYKQLVDNLRTYSLQGYLLDRRYRSAARRELAKVDWSRQPAATRRLYRLPLPLLRLRRAFLTTASRIKQWTIRHSTTR